LNGEKKIAKRTTVSFLEEKDEKERLEEG